jgi:hypothetical protein
VTTQPCRHIIGANVRKIIIKANISAGKSSGVAVLFFLHHHQRRSFDFVIQKSKLIITFVGKEEKGI